MLADSSARNHSEERDNSSLLARTHLAIGKNSSSITVARFQFKDLSEVSSS